MGGLGKWPDEWGRTLTPRGSGRSCMPQWVDVLVLGRPENWQRPEGAQRSCSVGRQTRGKESGWACVSAKCPREPYGLMTHQMGGDQTIHWGSRGLGHALPLPPCDHIALASPSLERAGKQRGSWKDSAFVQKKMYHRRSPFKREETLIPNI